MSTRREEQEARRSARTASYDYQRKRERRERITAYVLGRLEQAAVVAAGSAIFWGAAHVLTEL